MKMKMRREEPERLPHQLRADEAFEKAVQALDQPFQKILRAVGDLLHVPGRHLCEEDEGERHQPSHDHRVGDRKTPRPGDLHGLLRQPVLLAGDDRRTGVHGRDRQGHESR